MARTRHPRAHDIGSRTLACCDILTDRTVLEPEGAKALHHPIVGEAAAFAHTTAPRPGGLHQTRVAGHRTKSGLSAGSIDERQDILFKTIHPASPLRSKIGAWPERGGWLGFRRRGWGFGAEGRGRERLRRIAAGTDADPPGFAAFDGFASSGRIARCFCRATSLGRATHRTVGIFGRRPIDNANKRRHSKQGREQEPHEEPPRQEDVRHDLRGTEEPFSHRPEPASCEIATLRPPIQTPSCAPQTAKPSRPANPSKERPKRWSLGNNEKNGSPILPST